MSDEEKEALMPARGECGMLTVVKTLGVLHADGKVTGIYRACFQMSPVVVSRHCKPGQL